MLAIIINASPSSQFCRFNNSVIFDALFFKKKKNNKCNQHLYIFIFQYDLYFSFLQRFRLLLQPPNQITRFLNSYRLKPLLFFLCISQYNALHRKVLLLLDESNNLYIYLFIPPLDPLSSLRAESVGPLCTSAPAKFLNKCLFNE